MKPKIIHIDNSPATTGAYKALLSWCKSAEEFEHIWVLPRGSEVIAEVESNFKCYTLPFVEIGRDVKKLVAYVPALLSNGRRLAKIISKEKPAIVHLNDLYNLTVFSARIWERNFSIVTHARMLKRSFPARIYDFWKGMQLKYADRIIAVSEIIKHDWGNDERIEVIYDPITITEKLAPYKFEQSAGGVFKFLYLANYIKGKGQEDALSAIKYLKEELGCSDFTVNFYGGTMNLEKNETYKQSLRDFVTAHKLADFVTLHEAVSDVEAVMKKYQGALHFSHSESFGMVCFEALYYGLPVISSDCGGPAEMIEDGISGILLPVSDYKSFAAAMKRWIINPEDAERIGKNAATFIQRKFLDNPNTLTNMFTEVYESKGRKN